MDRKGESASSFAKPGVTRMRSVESIPLAPSRQHLVLVGFFLLLAGLPSWARADEPPPNVLLITIDTLRADRLGCYGYEKARTPNIDRLAVDGVRFEKAYTPVPITLPAHAVMFTGAYPMRIGMHDFSGNRLGADQPVLAAMLREQGYATAGIVGSAVLDSRFGFDRGFDFYYDEFDFSRLNRPCSKESSTSRLWASCRLGFQRPLTS